MKAPVTVKDIGKIFRRSPKTGDAAGLEDRLISAFAETTEILEKENEFLKAVSLQDVQKLLPEKTASLANLKKEFEVFSSSGDYANGISQRIGAEQKRFNLAVQENTVLLDASIAAQKVVMRMLVESAVQGGFSGYGPKGEPVSGKTEGMIAHQRDA